jgi:quercetin dioxygenase-like cupin family protein
MPVFETTDCRSHAMHGAEFHSYVAPSRGSAQLCAWRVDVEPGTAGVEHEVSDEEVFLVLAGSPVLTLDGTSRRMSSGSVALAKAGSTVKLDNLSNEPAELWVTTVAGLTATTADGSVIAPPWAE